MSNKPGAHQLPYQHSQVGSNGLHPALQVVKELAPVLSQCNHLQCSKHDSSKLEVSSMSFDMSDSILLILFIMCCLLMILLPSVLYFFLP